MFAGRIRREDGWLPGGPRGGRNDLEAGKVAELESMYVREGYRDRGVGARLVDEFLGWAGSRGAELASVVAYATNERAIRFYQRSGFRPRSVSLEREI